LNRGLFNLINPWSSIFVAHLHIVCHRDPTTPSRGLSCC